MRQFWLLLFIAPFLFLSCSEDNQTPESPADADDNFITSVVMTVASQSYTAEIIDNIITITVPYTVSLNNAQVEFKYTSSATENVPKVIGAEILKVANCFDNMTAMKFGDEPLSEIAAIRYLLEMEDQFDRKIVDALLDSINILSPGVCVEFTNGDKGLVVTANDSNVLEPFVLSFNDNKLYNLADSKVAEQMKIKDIMKTMDNRHVVDREFLSQYMGKTLHMGEK